jgi:purine nucleosidase
MRKIIIDTDPSPDDALAIVMALAHPQQLELLAITTVGGNVPLPYTTRNALMTLELLQRPEVAVYAGAPGPLRGPLVTAEYVHGPTGFEGYALPPPQLKASPGFAPEKIVELLRAQPDASVTLCCLAPLTNIALALQLDPGIAAKIEAIVLMGGARSEGGNVTPAAEYNFYVDPEAAAQVIACGRPITVIPLDATHQALTSCARMERIRAIGSPLSEAFYHLLNYNKQFDAQQWQSDGGPLHDPTVVAYLLQPELFVGKAVNLEIELEGRYTRGMSVVDYGRVTERPINAVYVSSLDAEGYFKLVTESIRRCSCPA